MTVAELQQIAPGYGLGNVVGSMQIGAVPVGGLYGASLWFEPTESVGGWNSCQFNECQFNDLGTLESVADSREFTGEYRLELRDPDGELLYKLPSWWGGQWVDRSNAPSTLAFRYFAYMNPGSSLVPPNEIWLYRGDSAYPEAAFQIAKRNSLEEEAEVLTVTAEDHLAQLAKERIDSYNLGGSTETVETIVRNWLNDHQDLDNPISLGYIDPSIGGEETVVSIAAKKKILNALMELHQVYGGFLYVTPQRRLVWRSDIGIDEGHILRFGRNAVRVERDIDYRLIETQLTATADDFAGDPLSVTLDDVAAQAVYGIIKGDWRAPDVVDEPTLTILAQNELTRRATPREVFTIGAIDLSHTTRFDYSFDARALQKGWVIRVRSAVSGLDITTKVHTVTRNLDNPLNVQIEVVDTSGGVGTDVSYKRRPDLISALAEMIDYVKKQKTPS